MKYITFGKPLIGENEKNEILDSLNNAWLGTGPKVAQFENSIKKYTKAKYACALSSGTAALFLSMKALGIGPGDEVITTSLTFVATVNAIEHVGAKPVIVDVDKGTGNIDPVLIEDNITKRTKAIIPVHYCGLPCDMDEITRIAKKHKLYVIEDAAHCLEGSYKGRKIGSISTLTCFSFYATKNVTTGEGGMVVSNNKDLINKIRIYSLHGLCADAWKRYSDKGHKTYEVTVPGYKFNMMDLQAAIGIHQIKQIKSFYKIRLEQWRKYNNELKDLPVILPPPLPNRNILHALHLYTILIDKKKCSLTRENLQTKLHERGIGTGIHFIAVHNHKYYKKKYAFKPNSFPNANYVSERTISLPIGPALKKKEQDYIIKTLRAILKDVQK
ncbi:MAG: DegT/DnrJ/EryC1/StrS family aminotransferase [Bacteroidetes bacterium]|nr:DegT/DnrJ/EryC1/StrS family aminotransferase [Bacteroidota bacterium]